MSEAHLRSSSTLDQTPENATLRPEADEFFIGWLTMPPTIRSFIITAATVIIISCVAFALILPPGQHSPGSAVWETAETSVEGVVTNSPYPMLRVADQASVAGVRTVFLVEQGKHGAVNRFTSLDCKPVRVTGTFLHRNDRWMLELSPGPTSIQPIVLPIEVHDRLVRATKNVNSVTMQGEIIDPKCYLGAMKPGGGKTHRACAALCVSGGIPPMFVTHEDDGREVFYLLTDKSGAAINGPILPYVGDVVELKGDLEIRDDLNVLRIDVADIKRL